MTNWQNGEFQVSDDLELLDFDTIHEFLALHSNWARDIPRSTLEKSIRNSLSFGVFHGSKQVGFARVISDSATVAYLGDVFIVPEYRGRGLAKWLMPFARAAKSPARKWSASPSRT